MTLNDAYYEFSLLLNKNSERKDIQLDKLNYIVLYNRESLRWVSEFLERNNNSDNIFTLSQLLVNAKKLTKKQTNLDNEEYELPNDFFKLLAGNSYSNVKATKCNEEGIVYNYFKKPNNWNIEIEDKFIRPSYAWERGLGEIYQNKIVIYKTDFDILNTFISYYKLPKKLNVKTPDYTEELELDDYTVGQINDRIVTEVYREFNNGGYQLAATREKITL
jgi:hypothetical protein